MTDGGRQMVMGLRLRAAAAVARGAATAAGLALRLLRFGLSALGTLVLLALVLAALMAVILAGAGQGVPVPPQALAQAEARLNRALAASLPSARLSISGVDLSLSSALEPSLTLRDLVLRDGRGNLVAQLPRVRAVLAPQPLLSGQVILRQLHLDGADLRLRRDAEGRLDIGFATAAAAASAPAATAEMDVRGMFALTDRLLASPLAAELSLVTAQDLQLSLIDARGGLGALTLAQLQGTGQLRAQRSGPDISLDLRLALPAQPAAGGRPPAGQVDLALAYRLGSQAARLTAGLRQVYARDLAAQAAPLAFLAVLDAPISGQIEAAASPQGLGALSARFALGAGALDPLALSDGSASGAGLARVPFQSAQLDLAYDPALGRIALNDLSITSQSLTLRGAGQADMRGPDNRPMPGPFSGQIPAGFDVQLRLDHLRFARPELFAQPVVFDAGAAQLSVALAPFAVHIGHLGLTSGATELAASGQIAAQDSGWSREVKLSVNQIAAGKLLGLWPKSLLPATRDWLDRNLLAARFTDLRLALDQRPGAVPDLDFTCAFDQMVLTPVAGLPAITGGAGRGQIKGRAFRLDLQRGGTTPPLGGALDLAGSDFVIRDITRFPALGEVTLRSSGSLTATLSLIDQRPFQFLTKSGRAVDFATGTARLTTHLRLPLTKIVALPDVSFQMRGQVKDFASNRLVTGHDLALPVMQVSATKAGLRLSGAGQISGVEFSARYMQNFGKGAGPAQVTGQVPLNDEGLQVFGLRLPQGMVKGTGSADVQIDLPRGQPARLVLTSDLRGLSLALPALAYAKAAKTKGSLRAQLALSAPPRVESIDLQAGDLQFAGASVTLDAQGALERADFPGLTLGKWLAGDVALVAQGAERPLRVELGVGPGQSTARIDLRHMPRLGAGAGQGNAAGQPLALRLDRLRISSGITLRAFQGDFVAGRGGLSGNFAARMERGGTPLQGQLAPAPHGTAVRILAPDAGQALAQAGIYRDARGGQLDLRLTPLAQAGHYQGQASIAQLRVHNNSVLADLLNAISVVGLLDQLGGPGILFNTVEGSFLLTPEGVDLRQGVATGASLGVTLQGIYRFAEAQIDMQGVISPIYLLNGVGAVISAPGEGLLGFNYRLRGAADAPRVRVNPLSVLLPGFMRNLFKPPPATLPLPQP